MVPEAKNPYRFQVNRSGNLYIGQVVLVVKRGKGSRKAAKIAKISLVFLGELRGFA